MNPRQRRGQRAQIFDPKKSDLKRSDITSNGWLGGANTPRKFAQKSTPATVYHDKPRKTEHAPENIDTPTAPSVKRSLSSFAKSITLNGLFGLGIGIFAGGVVTGAFIPIAVSIGISFTIGALALGPVGLGIALLVGIAAIGLIAGAAIGFNEAEKDHRLNVHIDTSNKKLAERKKNEKPTQGANLVSTLGGPVNGDTPSTDKKGNGFTLPRVSDEESLTSKPAHVEPEEPISEKHHKAAPQKHMSEIFGESDESDNEPELMDAPAIKFKND